MVSSRTLRHAHAIQQHLDALTTDLLCHELGWIVGPADLVDLDDSPINWPRLVRPMSLSNTGYSSAFRGHEADPAVQAVHKHVARLFRIRPHQCS